MPKLSSLSANPHFWISFIIGTLSMFAFETFLLGLWAILGYRISFMGAIDIYDIAFIAVFALVFGFGSSLFWMAKRCGKKGCSLGAAGGVTTFFTLLCPICPVFFLSYVGLSASVMAFAPFFWPLRAVALGFMLLGIFFLWRNFNPRTLSKISWAVFSQGSMAVAILFLLIGNQVFAMQIGESLLGPGPGASIKLSGKFSSDIAALVTPNTLPFYGPELGLDFSSLEKINASIKKLASMEPKRGSNAIEPTGKEMERYIAIGTQPTVTCEFCCGVKTLVREDGSATCGCAHARAMMGTAVYLLRNHPDMTNDEISYELVRQKGLYFPTQMQKRMAEQLSGEEADFSPDIKHLTQNLTATELANLQAEAQESGFVPPTENPGMVGGC